MLSLWANWLQLNSQLNSWGVSFCLYRIVPALSNGQNHFISYWNPCIWLAESKFVSEKHWQNAWWNTPQIQIRPHTCQRSLFNRNCPYFDPRKRKKKERFYHVFLFLQISACSNVYEIQECSYFKDIPPICPYLLGFRVGKYVARGPDFENPCSRVFDCNPLGSWVYTGWPKNNGTVY